MNFTKDWPVEVLWEDTYHETGWHNNVKEFCEVAKNYQHMVRTVGYIVLKNSKKVVISMSLTYDNGIGDILSIPRKNISCILKLEPNTKNNGKTK